jgi:prolyl-tRNA editing enzyme YbaK/EbsC (Cys-tRNA(Pro) deacylase)
MSVHPNVQAVQNALDVAGARRADGSPSQVRILPAAVHTAVAAAAALGVDAGQIANSLIFDAAGAPLLVLTSGAHRANTTRLAELAGVKAVRRASPDFVRRHTGQVIGGVAPVHPTVEGPQMRTLVDKVLFDYDEVWAAGGVPQAVFPITPDELRRLTNGDLSDVSGPE